MKIPLLQFIFTPLYIYDTPLIIPPVNVLLMSYPVYAGKKYRPDYMEDSITKYLTLCQAPEFAVRATLFDGLCLKHQGLFTEAATSYIRMTNELSDLRSAMLLEQVSGGMVVVGQ